MNLLKELLDVILIEKKTDKSDGTYVGAKFSSKTIKDLEKLLKELKIPNPISSDKFHTTIIFSRKKFPDNFKAKGKLDPVWKGTPKDLEIFPTRDSGKNALVLRYTCKEQKDRHEFLMDEYKATYDWPEYKIHLTLSYDCGDFDIKNIKITDYIDAIEVSEEYTEGLKLDWLTNKDNPNEKK